MPRFFTQSRIFQAATYRRFKTRLFGESTKSGGSSGAAINPKDGNGSRGFLDGRSNAPHLGYFEFQELREPPVGHAAAERGETLDGENDSGTGIAKTTTFDVIAGPHSTRYGEA